MNHRIYDERAIIRLKFIAAAKLLNLSLDEIRELLKAWDHDASGEVPERLRQLVAARMTEARQRIAELTTFANRLASVQRSWAGPGQRVEAAAERQTESGLHLVPGYGFTVEA